MAATKPLLASAWVRTALVRLCSGACFLPVVQNYPLAHEDGEGSKQQSCRASWMLSIRQDGLSWQGTQGSAAASVRALLASAVSPFYEAPAPLQAAGCSCPLP